MTDRERMTNIVFSLIDDEFLTGHVVDQLIEAGFGRRNGWIRDAEEDRFGAGMGLIHDD